jgi:hypothetical protein
MGELVAEARQLLAAQQEKKRSGLTWPQSFDLPMLSEWMHLTLPLAMRGLDQCDLALTLAVRLMEKRPTVVWPSPTKSHTKIQILHMNSSTCLVWQKLTKKPSLILAQNER